MSAPAGGTVEAGQSHRRSGGRAVGLAGRMMVALVMVVLTGVATAYLVASVVAPPVFRQHMQMAGEEITPGALEHIEEAFRSASGISLAVALVAALAVSIGASLYLTRRLAHSVRPVVHAAAEVASGHYRVRLDPPGLGAEFDELSAAFNHMAAQLDQVDETRRRLLGDLAHEVRTPVATLRAYLEALEDGLAPLDTETFAVMRAQTARLERLAEDVSAVSRAEEGGRILHLTDTAPPTLLSQAHTAAADRYAANGVRLVVSAPERLPMVTVDHERMGQVLTNLLDNALRYSPSGSTVVLSAAAAEGSVVLGVADEGNGIAAEHLPHVFERFYRADSARDRGHGGSGIGLAIVKALVEAHGGQVSVSSAGPGRGARFEIRLPAAPARAT